MVDRDGVSAFGETDEIIHILSVIAVPKRYPGGIDALGLKDIGLRLTAAVASIGMRFNWHTSDLAGACCCPEAFFFSRRDCRNVLLLQAHSRF